MGRFLEIMKGISMFCEILMIAKVSGQSYTYCYAHSDCPSYAPFCYEYYYDVAWGYCTDCYYCDYCFYGVDGTCGSGCSQTTYWGATCSTNNPTTRPTARPTSVMSPTTKPTAEPSDYGSSSSYCYSHSDCSHSGQFCYEYYYNDGFGYCTDCYWCDYCDYGIDGTCGSGCSQTTYYGATCTTEQTESESEEEEDEDQVMINGELCDVSDVVVVNNDCVQSAGMAEGSICGEGPSNTTAYCSYEYTESANACAYCDESGGWEASNIGAVVAVAIASCCVPFLICYAVWFCFCKRQREVPAPLPLQVQPQSQSQLQFMEAAAAPANPSQFMPVPSGSPQHIQMVAPHCQSQQFMYTEGSPQMVSHAPAQAQYAIVDQQHSADQFGQVPVAFSEQPPQYSFVSQAPDVNNMQ